MDSKNKKLTDHAQEAAESLRELEIDELDQIAGGVAAPGSESPSSSDQPVGKKPWETPILP